MRRRHASPLRSVLALLGFVVLGLVMLVLAGCGSAIVGTTDGSSAGEEDGRRPDRPQFDEDSELELASTPEFCDALSELITSLDMVRLAGPSNSDGLQTAYARLEVELQAIEPLVPNAGVQNQMDELTELYVPPSRGLTSVDWELIDQVKSYGAYHCGHDLAAIENQAVNELQGPASDGGVDVGVDARVDADIEAPPWAQLPDGSTVVGPSFRGWAEWPFDQLDTAARAELGISRFETDQRLIFLNVAACVPRSDVTVAYGWGLLNSAGQLLNTNHETIIFDWLEAPYRQPEEASCGEGWVGVMIDHDIEPVSVVWTDAWNSLQQTWPIGSPVTPATIEPVADNLTIAEFGDEADGSSGSHWAVLDLVTVATEDAETPPPAGTTWWVAEAQYCAPPGDSRIWDELQLAVDGWYVFNRSSREIALDQAHPVQPPIPAGQCGFIWETFAVPTGLEPTHVRLSGEAHRTVWR